MKTTLVIMAAGIGSRYGGGIKQLALVGPRGQIIMDYSIHDAIEAGFNKIVFIIRHDIEADFRQVIGDRIEKVCEDRNIEVAYAFQELTDLPEGFEVPEGRTKPWGTGHAILACKDIVKEPFAIINADDYYGKEAFVKIHDFLLGLKDGQVNDYCMAGFILGNTLSDHGCVTRGVCNVDENDYLTNICETHNIYKTEEGALVKDENESRMIPLDCHVSMNMWGHPAEFITVLDEGFTEFLGNLEAGDLKSEYLLPTIIGDLLKEKKITVKVLETKDKWFGVTYHEDKDMVVKAFEKLTEDGVYTPELF